MNRADLASKFHPFSADNKEALLDSFKKGELFTDRYRVIFFWLYLDGGQMFMVMQMAEKMENQKLTDNERKWGEMVTESIVDKGVTTRTFNKRYWKHLFSFEGMKTAKNILPMLWLSPKERVDASWEYICWRISLTDLTEKAFSRTLAVS